MAKPNRTPLLLIASTWPLIAQQFVDNLFLRALLLALQVTLVGLMLRGISKKDPELEAQEKRELRTQKIRELEAELGMKPMELWSDEDPDIVGRPIKKDEEA